MKDELVEQRRSSFIGSLCFQVSLTVRAPTVLHRAAASTITTNDFDEIFPTGFEAFGQAA
ncbi:hypothetical protein HFO55_35205 [Rhizobium leguminosarum]|uniref:hypothetical protein n=1 Tax=Rhizobium leguminosarum TaxID=384 RepID=UPI001C9768E4|nr:hypothetical protein [Rhizobium leguminosarum]MBY5572336.1 hypothetical protein [Rhizobium leguminosarum]MBY5579026.1 hypothetical protein [Rhizobium leguminosarum]